MLLAKIKVNVVAVPKERCFYRRKAPQVTITARTVHFYEITTAAIAIEDTADQSITFSHLFLLHIPDKINQVEGHSD